MISLMDTACDLVTLLVARSQLVNLESARQLGGYLRMLNLLPGNSDSFDLLQKPFLLPALIGSKVVFVMVGWKGRCVVG